MAPEVLSGNYGRKVDYWAFGVAVFLMAFRCLPFDSSEEVEGKQLDDSALGPVLAGALQKGEDQRTLVAGQRHWRKLSFAQLAVA